MKLIILQIIKFYKKFISPLLPPSCIYYPTCSEYTMESIEKFGIIKGVILGFFRIIRCNSFLFTGGVDKIPQEFSFNIIKEKFNEFKIDK